MAYQYDRDDESRAFPVKSSGAFSVGFSGAFSKARSLEDHGYSAASLYVVGVLNHQR